MDSAGNVGFAILVVIFILGTYALALSLESIIDQWSRLTNEKWEARGLTMNGNRNYDAESTFPFNALGSCCGFRRGWSGDESEEKISKAA